ncbi:hypothetical protein G9A89_000260 [Geosiphon pyriformis]|nr:hypothetical protein G9A89_000260 [Geosiphon pyriformis]
MPYVAPYSKYPRGCHILPLMPWGIQYVPPYAPIPQLPYDAHMPYVAQPYPYDPDPSCPIPGYPTIPIPDALYTQISPICPMTHPRLLSHMPYALSPMLPDVAPNTKDPHHTPTRSHNVAHYPTKPQLPQYVAPNNGTLNPMPHVAPKNPLPNNTTHYPYLTPRSLTTMPGCGTQGPFNKEATMYHPLESPCGILDPTLCSPYNQRARCLGLLIPLTYLDILTYPYLQSEGGAQWVLILRRTLGDQRVVLMLKSIGSWTRDRLRMVWVKGLSSMIVWGGHGHKPNISYHIVDSQPIEWDLIRTSGGDSQSTDYHTPRVGGVTYPISPFPHNKGGGQSGWITGGLKSDLSRYLINTDYDMAECQTVLKTECYRPHPQGIGTTEWANGGSGGRRIPAIWGSYGSPVSRPSD